MASLDDLQDERRSLLDDAHAFKEQYRKLREELQPAIDQLQSEADELTQTWKPYVIASREAYAAGDGESAKQYSELYKPHYEACKRKNAEANALRDQLASLRVAVNDAFASATDLEHEIASIRRSRRDPDGFAHGVSVLGFAESCLGTDRQVLDVIASFPATLWRHVSQVSYRNKPFNRDGHPVRGWTEYGKGPGARIVITKHLRNDTPEGIAYVLGHESAHVAWRYSLGEGREWWREQYSAMLGSGDRFPTDYARAAGPEELFAESWALYSIGRAHFERAFPALAAKVCEARTGVGWDG